MESFIIKSSDIIQLAEENVATKVSAKCQKFVKGGQEERKATSRNSKTEEKDI